MKKIFLFLVAAVLSLSARADEGMWLLPYLQKMNIKDMQDKGCKLSAEEIYSLNKNSLKDAIVIFGRGCTGEIVSPEGLLFTNHHCGYGSIQSLSSVEHDYLKNGFWAMSNAEEIPAPGLEVRFIRHISDVTADLIGNVPSIAGEKERREIVQQNIAELASKLQKANQGKEIIIKSFFGGNQYFAFVIDVFSDVRLVGTPPTSIGKFGGETDNWMWPRHTGDFSIFRVYAGKDNQPAAYSSENVPYKAEKFLKVSLDGYKEGDFAMIMGFPGRTYRYMTSYEIDRMLNVENPQRIFIRGERQAILAEDMAASDAVRIQYAAKYAQSANYWKNSIGMSRGIKKLNVKAKKEAQEAAFESWAVQNTLPEEGFIDALPKIREAIEVLTPLQGTDQYLSEALWAAVEIMEPASVFYNVKDSLTEADILALRERLMAFYKDYNPSTDRKVAKQMLQIVRENVKDLPSFYETEINTKFGGNIDAYVDDMYDNSVAADQTKIISLLENYSKEKAQADPAVILIKSFFDAITALSNTQGFKEAEIQLNEGQRLYIAGLMRMQSDKAWASDANGTIRLTYGQVLPYDPADGITYNYHTTLSGMVAKEDPTNPEFVVPEKIKQLHAVRDYGRYVDAEGNLPVAFLANCDITGGNSGSPIMNAKGELIGLAFDGNWEAMSGDVAFEPELQRTISVDARYVLFVIDKFAGAGWLIDEMELVQNAPKKRKCK